MQTVQEQSGSAELAGLLSVEEARARIVAAMPVLGAEKIRVGSAAGRVLAEDIVARVSLPPMPVSAMDGYACRSTDVMSLPATLQKIGISKAGSHFAGSVTAGTCVRIFTGAVVPQGADVIALQEDATEQDDAVTIEEVPKPGQFIRPMGMDFGAGQRCVTRGRVLTARDLGVIASCGPSLEPTCWSRVAVRQWAIMTWFTLHCIPAGSLLISGRSRCVRVNR
jgi:molybdopterin molybdotransferase